MDTVIEIVVFLGYTVVLVLALLSLVAAVWLGVASIRSRRQARLDET